ncbi:glycoside hydrolase [Lentisphaera profundi]|uniref:Glycoside hydrolase n=1 Tax=Lentisphaera profundi TaxID=1658616 RepID=A0ABY7VXY5_9BACT|nr:glycoside hydrolase [Lentisphaera profundi]WDE97569.1 glycoside hydrolase [Lentisphaera profundi]
MRRITFIIKDKSIGIGWLSLSSKIKLYFSSLFFLMSFTTFSQENDVLYIEAQWDKPQQTLEHFGSSTGMYGAYIIEQLKSEQDRNLLASLLFSKKIKSGQAQGIGLSCFRVELGAGSATQANGGGIVKPWRQTHSFMNKEGKYSSKYALGTDWWIKAAHRYEVDKLIAYSNSAPFFMNKNGLTYKSEESMSTNLPKDKYVTYAKYLATIARYYQRQGKGFDYISPFNEPQWPWSFSKGKAKQEGSPWTNQEIFEVTKEIDKAFNTTQVNAKIVTPEAAHIKYLYKETKGFAAASSNQIEAFWGKKSPYSLNSMTSVEPLVAGHTYFVDEQKSLISTRKALRKKMAEVAPQLRFWQSEYSLLEKAYLEGRESHKSMSAMDCALFLAKVIHHDLTIAQATSWQFWSSFHPELHGSLPRFNLVTAKIEEGTLETEPTKLLWALGHFSRWIRPGMKRYLVKGIDDEASENKDLMVSVYGDKETQEKVWVIINYGNEARDFVVSDHLSRQLKSYLTTSQVEKNMSYMGMKKANQKIEIPARSIMTLVMEN